MRTANKPSALAMAPLEMKRHTYVLRRFIGLDLHDAPPDIAEGYVTQADNLISYGGRPRSRPGKVGILSSLFGSPPYILDEYVVGGVAKLLVTAGSKLYAVTPPSNPGVGSATVVEIKYASGASANVISAKAVADSILNQTTSILVVVDGSSNPPLYINPATNLVAAAGGLNGPIAPLTATLTNHELTDLSALPYSSGSDAPVELLPTTDFGNADWTGTGALSDDGNNGWWMDQTGDQIELTNAAVTPVSMTTGRYPNQFSLSFNVRHTNGSDSPWDPGKCTVTVYSDTGGTTSLGSQDFTFSGDVATILHSFDFSMITTDIRSIQIKWETTVDHHFHGYTVEVPSLTTFATGFQLVAEGSEILVGPGAFFFDGTGIACAGASVDFDMVDDTDWSSYTQIFLPLRYNPTTVPDLQLVLRFRQFGSSDTYDSNPMVISSDGQTATVDVSASIPPAVLANFHYLSVVVTDNLNFTSEPAVLFGLSTVVAAGNLTADGFSSVIYVYTEINSLGDTTYARIIESNPSPLSSALTPSTTQAIAIVSLPSGPVNASSDAFKVYRIGGVYDDGIGRSLFPFSAERWDTDDPNGTIVKNQYIVWDKTAHTLTDNTPDGFLLNSSDLLDYGHDPPPVGAQFVVAWQKRLCLAVGSHLYVSSLTDADGNAALYFPRANLVSDPNAAVKGFFTGTGSGNAIVALLAYGTNLVIDKGPQDGIYLGFGYDVRNFALQSYLLKSGVGSVAFGCLQIVRNHAWLLGPDGWYEFNADTSAPTSLAIDRLLSPALAGQAPLNPAAYAASRAVYHARRLLHFAPSAHADTTNTIIHVWDSRTGGWTNWLIAATGGVSLSATADTGACFIGGYDGQIYQLTGVADIASPGGSATAIAGTLSTRAIGQEGGGEDYFREKHCTRVFGEILTESGSGGTIQLGVTFQGGSYLPNYTLLPGASGAGVTTSARRTMPHWVRGRNMEIVVQFSSTALLEIGAVGAELTQGKLLR